MQTRVKAIAVALVFAALGFMLNPSAPIGQAVWGPQPEGPAPEGAVLGALVLYSVLEAIAFGLGAAFIAFGWPLVKKAAASTAGASAAFAAIAWMLVSWVPHSAMHMTNAHDDFARLALIEYVFHVTLIASAIVLARFLLGVVREAGERKAVAAQATPVKVATRP